jgi:hypothetical protein
MSRRSGLRIRRASRAIGHIGLAGLVASCAALGCGAGRDSAPARVGPASINGAPETSLRTPGLRAADDPTVAGGRLLPANLDEAHAWGVEPGGGVRAVVGGVRVVTRPDGTILTEDGRLPGAPSSTVEVPERLGGGFLFATGKRLWRGASWLATPRILSDGSVSIERVLVGLDRVYLRFGGGSLAAIDPRDGARLDLGPLPSAPRLVSVASVDAWHAIAIADLRGILVTGDAGSTWRAVPIPVEPAEAFALGDSFRVAGRDAANRLQWWRVGPDLRAEPVEQDPHHDSRRTHLEPASREASKLSGTRGLAAAVTDGWPLADGTALIARDGSLTRVRLADGSCVEEAADAFAMNPARCHPFSLATPRDRGAFGYTCGEPRGQTRIYVWQAGQSRLAEVRRFYEPRQVNAFGNGTLAVRGPCQGLAGSLGSETTVWCVMLPGGRFAERIVRGAGARLVVLSDGRTAVLSPPTDGDLATVRLAVAESAEGSRESFQPVVLPELTSDVARALRFGVWMDGFEERKPGWLSGWVDFAGSALGIEIALSGQAHLGEYIRDAGAPLVAGRWGFVWTASRRGFETTDGGMTWTKGISLPDPLPQSGGYRERVCGPVGCLEAGWVRIGWGVEPRDVSPEPRALPAPRPQSGAPPLRLRCEPSEPVTESQARAIRAPMLGGQGDPVSHFPDFAQGAGPAIPAPDVGVWADPSSGFGSMLRAAPLARVYAWGPHDADWDSNARWELRWVWPWGPAGEVRASAQALAPWPQLDVARGAMVAGGQSGWTVVGGDDPDHALLVMRRSAGTPGAQLLLLETGRAPTSVRAPPDSFEAVEAAARLGGRWYVVASARARDPSAAVVWSVEGAEAHELARVPRVGLDAHPRLYLSRRSDGRALGVAVEGQPDVSRAASLWMMGIDPDSGEASEPTALVSLDAADHAVPACEGDETGWVLDWPYPASVEIRMGERWTASLVGVTARIRVSAARACIESVVGSADREAVTAPEALYRTPLSRSARERELPAMVYSAKTHFHLRCALP